MKKLSLVLLLLAGLAFTACEQEAGTETQEAAEAGATAENATPTPGTEPSPAEGKDEAKLPVTKITFTEESHNFGKIKEGDVVSHTFKFKNEGSNPLVIKNVKPSCGCTTPEWTKDPIGPGKDGVIKVSFDSKGKPGVANKSVTVEANIEGGIKQLTFTGEVIAQK